jgi:hypothetical protein
MILVVLPSTTPATLPVNIPAWKDTGTNRNRRVKRGKTNLSIDRLRAPWWQRETKLTRKEQGRCRPCPYWSIDPHSLFSQLKIPQRKEEFNPDLSQAF